jgi:hypothetical protein
VIAKAWRPGPKVSFKEVATKHWRSLMTCIGVVVATNVTYYMLLTYMPSYLSHNLHYSENRGVLIIIAIMVGMLFVQPADRLHQRQGRTQALHHRRQHRPVHSRFRRSC